MSQQFLKFVSNPAKDHCSVYTLQEWFENGRHLWSEYDGGGYWGIEGYHSGMPVHQSECPPWATHVVWFNK